MVLCGVQRDVIRSSEGGSHAWAGSQNNTDHLSEEMGITPRSDCCILPSGQSNKKGGRCRDGACDDVRAGNGCRTCPQQWPPGWRRMQTRRSLEPCRSFCRPGFRKATLVTEGGDSDVRLKIIIIIKGSLGTWVTHKKKKNLQAGGNICVCSLYISRGAAEEQSGRVLTVCLWLAGFLCPHLLKMHIWLLEVPTWKTKAILASAKKKIKIERHWANTYAPDIHLASPVYLSFFCCCFIFCREFCVQVVALSSSSPPTDKTEVVWLQSQPLNASFAFPFFCFWHFIFSNICFLQCCKFNSQACGLILVSYSRPLIAAYHYIPAFSC